EALVPRSFIVKHPLILALSREGKPLEELGPVYSVPPWSSRASQVAAEGLPVEVFFVRAVSEVVLTNLRSRFGGLYLRRRGDPIAMRGQQVFVQSCATCHAAGQ